MRSGSRGPTADALFRALADPTRRAIFERLAREGERTVHALTDRSGVSQPAVSKHLGHLKTAGLVIDRRDGRETHYSVRPLAWRRSWIGCVITANSGRRRSTGWRIS